MEFKEYKYSEIGKIKSGKRLPKGYAVIEEETDNKYIRVRDITNNSINYNEVKYITDEAAQQIKRYKVKAGDIIISVVGTVGAICEIPNELNEAYLTENCDNLLVNEDVCLKKYLKYFLISKDGQEQVKSNTVGSNQPKLPIYGIENFDIKVPTIKEQRKILCILDNIDKKIGLNNKINNNLYESSYEVFKNFKEEIKKQTIKEFCNFKELGSIIMGQSPKGESYNFENIGIPLINGAADYQNGYLKPQKYTSMPTKVCKKGDLIFCIRATIGLIVVSNEEYCLGRGVAGIINTYDYYKEYVYHLINNSINEFKRMATGSVIVGITRDDIGKMKVSVPSEKQIIKFHTVQKPIFDKIENIREENKTLVQLRDTLLPKLMNGEIDLDKIKI